MSILLLFFLEILKIINCVMIQHASGQNSKTIKWMLIILQLMVSRCYLDQIISLIILSILFGQILSILPILIFLFTVHLITMLILIWLKNNNQHVDLSHWEFISFFCTNFSIIPPLISTLTATKSIKRKIFFCNTALDEFMYVITLVVMMMLNI